MAEMIVARPGGMGSDSEQEEDQLSAAGIVAQTARHSKELANLLDADFDDEELIGGQGQGAVSNARIAEYC